MNKSVFITIYEIYDSSNMTYLYINFKCDKYEYKPHIEKKFLIEEINIFKANGYKIHIESKYGDIITIIDNNFHGFKIPLYLRLVGLFKKFLKIFKTFSKKSKNKTLNLDGINFKIKKYNGVDLVYIELKKIDISDGIINKKIDMKGGGQGNTRKEHGRCHFSIKNDKGYDCEIYLPGADSKTIPTSVKKIEYKTKATRGKVDEKFLLNCLNKKENLIKIGKEWNNLNKDNNTPNLILVKWV